MKETGTSLATACGFGNIDYYRNVLNVLEPYSLEVDIKGN